MTMDLFKYNALSYARPAASLLEKMKKMMMMMT